MQKTHEKRMAAGRTFGITSALWSVICHLSSFYLGSLQKVTSPSLAQCRTAAHRPQVPRSQAAQEALHPCSFTRLPGAGKNRALAVTRIREGRACLPLAEKGVHTTLAGTVCRLSDITVPFFCTESYTIACYTGNGRFRV